MSSLITTYQSANSQYEDQKEGISHKTPPTPYYNQFSLLKTFSCSFPILILKNLLILKAHHPQSRHLNKRYASLVPSHEPIRAISLLAHPLPLIDQDQGLRSDVLDNGIHLDVVPVEAEGVLELGGYAVDSVEGEDD